MAASFSKKLIELRKAIVEGLQSASIPFVGKNIFSSRTLGGFPDEGDFISVYTNSNQFEDGDRSPVIYKVTSDVIVDVVVQGSIYDEETERDILIDERMDQITDAVLRVLVHNSIPGNIYKDLGMKKVRVTSIQNTLAGDGETDKGTQRISLSFMWYLRLPVGSAEDDFLEAGNSLKVAGSDNSIDWITKTRSIQ